MNAIFQSSVSILFLFVTVFGQTQFYGFFRFIGFINNPQISTIINEIHDKSRRECSWECLKDENCYFFDFCKVGSSFSCYFHNNNVLNTSGVESGVCRRYELKQTCDIGFTSPCRCPSNMGDERCNYKYDCSGNLVDRSTPSYSFYKTFPNNVAKEMWCEMEIDNGGWIVFQRRVDGTTDFYRGWKEYENGFGDLGGNFYMGRNYYLHEIVKSEDYELRIELKDQAGEQAYAGYTDFLIGGPATFYKLEVSGFYGNAGDSLEHHNGMMFTTFDRDNDVSASNCAFSYKGAWWYRGCHFSNLNGQYGTETPSGIIWCHWRGFYHSLVRTQMMVRRKFKHQY